ncbi:DUF4231 domain-containing protein [Terrabacter sp. Root181]|uniref:DUF4231 domain-containing protein n=1 Tax=Terrabacter sp. Root181 TaxID=1736484 RepID=UPI0007012B3F|nr:DUF4231 domain-containing protein [Terrabacter sp. Root181]KRB42963.1 hypothetical protein ASD90_21480 [Terrabacter sp. Root181]
MDEYATLVNMRSQAEDNPGKGGGAHGWMRVGGALPEPPRAEDRDDPLWQELTAEFNWYDRAATRSRITYQILKLTALVAGAAVTVLAAIAAPPALTASLAGAIVVLEGAQQMFQLHSNWISYRSTSEALRRHAFLYVADVSPFNDPATRRERLAAFLKDLTARENTSWTDTMRQIEARGSGQQR